METPVNPPAFPCTGNPEWEHQEGMRLRDYFAAKALSGLLSDSTSEVYSETLEKTAAEYARLSYIYADAMLKARGVKS